MTLTERRAARLNSSVGTEELRQTKRAQTLTPRLGYAEQDPEQWWSATVLAVCQAQLVVTMFVETF